MATYAPTDLVIANLALSHIRAGSIASLTENSVPAQEVNKWYSTALFAALEANDWTFARALTPIVELDAVDVPNIKPGWAYAIEYPVDALKIRGIVRDYAGEPDRKFEVGTVGGTKVIYSNKREGFIRYTRAVDNPMEFSAQFVVAFSHMLASLISIPVGGSPELAKQNEDLFRLKVIEAGAGDLNEGNRDAYDPHDRDPDWIEAR